MPKEGILLKINSLQHNENTIKKTQTTLFTATLSRLPFHGYPLHGYLFTATLFMANPSRLLESSQKQFAFEKPTPI